MIKIVETELDFSSLSERPYTDMIVLHHTGGNDIDASAEQIHGWHKKNDWAGIGYHYVIRKDGTIERGRPEWAIGSHAYGENSHTIGIHVSGNFDTAKPTDQQIKSCKALIKDICVRYGIVPDFNHIVGHGELMSTACPGRNLQALIDNGTLYDDVETVEKDGGEQEGTRLTERFNTVDSCPEWAQPTIFKMIEKGLLKGSGMKDEKGLPADLDLSLDMLRIFVVNDRANLY